MQPGIHATSAGGDEVVLEALTEHQARRRGMEVVITPELERRLDVTPQSEHRLLQREINSRVVNQRI